MCALPFAVGEIPFSGHFAYMNFWGVRFRHTVLELFLEPVSPSAKIRLGCFPTKAIFKL